MLYTHVTDATINGSTLWPSLPDHALCMVMQVLMLHVATFAGIPHLAVPLAETPLRRLDLRAERLED